MWFKGNKIGNHSVGRFVVGTRLPACGLRTDRILIAMEYHVVVPVQDEAVLGQLRCCFQSHGSV